MKHIYSIISALSLVCILLITYSCKMDSQEVYHFTKNYIDADGNPDVFSLIEDLKEAGCYSDKEFIVGYGHDSYYTVKLSVKKELEIPKKFTDIIEKSKDPVQVAKAKDAIEKAKAIHEENKTKFNKAYHLLLYGFNQIKTKATDSLIYESSTDGCDTLNVAITFDETPSNYLLPDYEKRSMHGKLSYWTILKKKSVIVIAEIGKDESTISLEYRTHLREERDNIKRAFCDPDTAAYDSVVMSNISSLSVRSVDVSYVFTPKINPEKSDSVCYMFYSPDFKSPCVSVGKHYFIPMKVDEAKSLIENIQKGLADVTTAQKFVEIMHFESDFKLRDAFDEPSPLFQVYASYRQGSPDNSHPKCICVSEGFITEGIRRFPRVQKGCKYFLLGVINPDGVHILRLNVTHNFCLPLDWINIKSCVDYDNTYYDITK